MSLFSFDPNNDLSVNFGRGINLNKYGASHLEITDLSSFYDSTASNPMKFNTFGCLDVTSANVIFMKYSYSVDFSSSQSETYYAG